MTSKSLAYYNKILRLILGVQGPNLTFFLTLSDSISTLTMDAIKIDHLLNLKTLLQNLDTWTKLKQMICWRIRDVIKTIPISNNSEASDKGIIQKYTLMGRRLIK